jgi:hypothetical protein
MAHLPIIMQNCMRVKLSAWTFTKKLEKLIISLSTAEKSVEMLKL